MLGSGFLSGSHPFHPVAEPAVDKFSIDLKQLPPLRFLSTGEEKRGSINQLLIVLCRKPHIVPVNDCSVSFSTGIFLSKVLR